MNWRAVVLFYNWTGSTLEFRIKSVNESVILLFRTQSASTLRLPGRHSQAIRALYEIESAFFESAFFTRKKSASGASLTRREYGMRMDAQLKDIQPHCVAHYVNSAPRAPVVISRRNSITVRSKFVLPPACALRVRERPCCVVPHGHVGKHDNPHARSSSGTCRSFFALTSTRQSILVYCDKFTHIAL